MKLTAAERHARPFAEDKQQREQEERECRDRVIAEFNGDPQAMATEILRYRHGVTQLADAIEWMRQGAPFISMGPGPRWRPKPVPVINDLGSQMTPALDNAEKRRRVEYTRETRAALQNNERLDQRIATREKAADEWARWLHDRMDAAGTNNALEVLPDALAKLEQLSRDHAAGAVRDFKQALKDALKP
jgi:hypothetical protein